MGTFTETLQFTIVTCYKCGTPFGILNDLNRRFHKTGEEFVCPSGHGQVYSESLESKLKTAESSAKFWKEQAEEKARSLSATRGVLTRTKNRIANGVCPCCNRQFVSLSNHMKNKHPDYVGE